MIGFGRTRERQVRPHGPSLLSMLTMIGLAGLFVSTKIDAKPFLEPTALPAPPPRWVSIERPLEVFSLSLPQFASAARLYKAERFEGARGRRDTIVFGDLAPGSSFLAVAVHRDAAEAAGFPTVARALTGIDAGGAGLAAPMKTKFGAIPTAEIALADRACLVFEQFEPAITASIEGVFCPPVGKVADRRTLACAVDRLDLMSAGSDTAIRRYFAEAERRRDFCGMGQVASVGTKPVWLDADGERPRLRN